MCSPRRTFPLALVAVVCALAPGTARAAVTLDNFRQSSHAGTSSLNLGYTVGAGADRLLLVGVSAARADVVVTGVSWRGAALTRVMGFPVTQGGRDCRLELWRLVDPPSGLGQIITNLSGMSAMGMGVVSYAGVDQQIPTVGLTTSTGTASPVRAMANAAGPAFATACLGGTWGMLNGPDATPGPGDVNLWDFTEQGVVGLGSYQAQSGGGASVSWNIAYNSPFSWGAIGVGINAVPPPPPDAGPDLAPDLAPPPPDLAPPPPDLPGPPDAGSPPPDADLGTGAPEPDAADPSPDADDPADLAAPPDDAAAADLSAPDDPDAGGGTARDVNLRVGCACRVGADAPAPLLPILLLLLALSQRRRLI